MTQARWLLCEIDDWRAEEQAFNRQLFFNVILDILNEDDPVGYDTVLSFSK